MTTVAALDRHPDLNPEHHPDLPLRSIDLIASVTNQSRFEPIDPPTVDRYVAALEDGATFPPIIVRRIPPASVKAKPQLVILGGNHRVRAHIDAGRKTIDAYLVECDDLVALEIAYHDNATHGLPPTEPERIAHALTLIDKGRTGKAAAGIVGINEQKLYRHITALQVDQRAARLGVGDDLTRIGIGVRPRLGSLKDDRIFTKVIRTVVREQMGQTVTQKLIGDINAQPDVASAMDVIEAHVRAHRDGIAGRGVGAPSRNPYLQLLTALGTIKGLNPSNTIDRCTSARDRRELHDRLIAAGRHLMAIDKLLTADEPRLEIAR